MKMRTIHLPIMIFSPNRSPAQKICIKMAPLRCFSLMHFYSFPSVSWSLWLFSILRHSPETTRHRALYTA